MNYQVHIISDAEEDISEIYQYVANNDSPVEAEKLLNKLEETCLSLRTFPNRGHVPPELKRVAVLDYLEIHYKPLSNSFKTRLYSLCVRWSKGP